MPQLVGCSLAKGSYEQSGPLTATGAGAGAGAAVPLGRATSTDGSGTAADPDSVVLKRSDVTLTKELGRGPGGGAYLGVYTNQRVQAREALGALDLERRKAVLDVAAALRRACNPPHPNVAIFYGVVIDARGILAVTEYCENGTLTAYLATNPKLAAGPRLSILAQVARGMAHLHGLSPPILHRALCARAVQVAQREGEVVA